MWVILHLLDHFNVINSRHIVVIKIMNFLNALFSYPLNFIRKFIPLIGGVDISPAILYLFISLVKRVLFAFIY
ncbi:MAG: YggT family protein [Rickettsiales bacterium]|nr:YggT family protein [Rickettsiales bacterium]